ncbi:MAG: response regulator [Acidobacteria bacterium]|nr:response regulator [Acidobacteriota bacterium]
MARKILLADDSVTAQNMGRRILSDAGYDVVTVNNGSAALKKIAEHKPDLIILDIYMPGYGGLEVCQRLKENNDTARIPVLLTVGKLEPFKPEDARRVRAEAFIVKPFEASELLTALTKLEDRIVPQASKQPAKPGRFAKVMAALEDKPESFGDAETGWKERIKLPTPGETKPEVEAPQPVVAATPHPALDRAEDFKPQDSKKDFERPVPAGLPADITPEEIAAFAAAASAVGSKTPKAEEKIAEPGKVEAVEAQASELTPIAAEKTAPAEEQAPAVAAAPVSEATPVAAAETAAPTEISQTTKAIAPVEIAPSAVEVSAQSAASAEASAPVAEAQPAEVPEKPLDAEVDAALASLAPAIDAVSPAHVEAPALAGVAAAGAPEIPRATGPRWIAESVPLHNDEALMVLEQEMEKAYAAMVAAEAAAAQLDAGPAEVPPAPEMTAPVAAAAGEPPAAPAADAAAVSETPAPQTEPVENPPNDMVAAAAEVPSEPQAAYAVAAAGGSTASEVPAEVSRVAAPEEEKVAEKLREAELAAAWKHWKNIRETMVGDQFTSQLAAAAQVEITSSAAEEAAEAADDSAQESGVAIASIVDSVLAELKPKLVEEIAKKLESDKKKKKKK